ncbi:MAG: glycosyltransferase [Clostridiales bacterium]|nr:glycosyltransferase [Clostridiales bacterium]
MKILYVTSLWSGFEDLIFGGKEIATGMPAFIYPLKHIIELGHQVDFIVTVPNPKPVLNINLEWLKDSAFHFVSWKFTGLHRVFSTSRLCFCIHKVLRSKRYDFVYGHGTVGALGCLMANWFKVPCGQRLYGTFLADEVAKKPHYYTALKHPLEYLAFRTSKAFLLITNDGTKGDYVYNKLGKGSEYKFHFLLNGIDLEPSKNSIQEQCDKLKPYLFFPARVARWKRQHLALDILEHLHNQGKDINLYFAGHISDTEYWEEIKHTAKMKGLAKYVVHLGKLKKEELFSYMHNSIAVLSLYQTSNLGNVVIEALATGSIVLAIDDGSLNEVIENGVNGILFLTTEEAANSIAGLLTNHRRSELIKKRAQERAEKQFISWENRAIKEVNFIESAIRK